VYIHLSPFNVINREAMTGHSTLLLVFAVATASDLFLSPEKGAQQPPTFRPMSIVAKRSPISATAQQFLVIDVIVSSK